MFCRLMDTCSLKKCFLLSLPPPSLSADMSTAPPPRLYLSALTTPYLSRALRSTTISFSVFTPLRCVSPPPLPLSSSQSPLLLLGCAHACWHITLIVPAVLIFTVNDRMPPCRGGGGIKKGVRVKREDVNEWCTDISGGEKDHVNKDGTAWLIKI